ncbi:MAG: YegP family protein [Chloroflexi bacterium]|nr:YegP family protein [Chloroflexota bacterium]
MGRCPRAMWGLSCCLRASRDNGIEAVKRVAPTAPVDDLT